MYVKICSPVFLANLHFGPSFSAEQSRRGGGNVVQARTEAGAGSGQRLSPLWWVAKLSSHLVICNNI